MHVNDLAGQTRNFLDIISRDWDNPRTGVWWNVKCRLCGTEKSLRGIDIACGKVKSCGCLLRHRFVDLTGKRYGRWTFISVAGKRRNGQYLWNVRCDCGTETVRVAPPITSGKSRSCGCLQDEMRSQNTTRHGHTKAKSPSRTYRAWTDMRKRCRNTADKNYPYYGGRGISVCERWDVFENFLSDMSECPTGMTLERKDVNGNYCPENCKWASRRAQSRNRRDTVLMTLNGETRSLAEWADILGIKQATIHMRLFRGWSHERALTTPTGR